MSVVLVRYLGSNSKPYAYLVPSGIEVEREDLVVVEARDTYALAKVTKTGGIHPDQAKWASKYIVQVVDLDAHAERKEELDAY